MKLSELLTGLASLDARSGAIEATGVTADSRKVKRGDVFVAVPGTKADGLAYAAQAAAAGAAAIVGEGSPPALPAGAAFIKVENARRALSLLAARVYPQQPKVIAAVTGTSGKTSVAAFTRQIWAALGHEAASVGTIGVVTAKARGLRLADHARPGRSAPHAVRAGGRGHHPSGDRGVVAWSRPAPARRRACRRRRLHQSEPRSSRLPSERRSLSCRQAAAVRVAGGRRRRRGDRCRSRAQRRGGRGGEKARAEAHHRRPQRRRHPT